MNNKLTRVFKNEKNELLTLSALFFDQGNSLVSISSLETPVNNIYISSVALPTRAVCNSMTLPWKEKNISKLIFKKLVARTTYLIHTINSQAFFNMWRKVHGIQLQNNEKIKIKITNKEAIIIPYKFFAKRIIQKHTTENFPQTRFNKKTIKESKKQKNLQQDILNNIVKITQQEILLAKQKVMKIQLG